MARPKKTNVQYVKEYWDVLNELYSGTPYRTIAKMYGVGVSTVQRLANKGLFLTMYYMMQ